MEVVAIVVWIALGVGWIYLTWYEPWIAVLRHQELLMSELAMEFGGPGAKVSIVRSFWNGSSFMRSSADGTLVLRVSYPFPERGSTNTPTITAEVPERGIQVMEQANATDFLVLRSLVETAAQRGGINLTKVKNPDVGQPEGRS